MRKITFLAAMLAVFTLNAQIFSDDFNLEVVDATTFTNWDSLDDDGDGEFWEVFDADATAYPWIMSGLGADSDSWEGGTPFNPDNYLITKTPIDLSGSTATEISFAVGTYQTGGTFLDDQYAVYMSTSNDPSTISGETPIYQALVGDDVTAAAGDGSDSAAALTLDASAYDGQSVYLIFRHWNTFDQNSVLIDDVAVTGTLSVGDQSFSNFVHFVDSSNVLRLSASEPMESVQLFNVLGQLVINNELNSNREGINIDSLNQGVYITRVTINGQTKTFKIVKR